ncbi:MAG: sialidase family protein, partial [Thermomicrobiales bacterium]
DATGTFHLVYNGNVSSDPAAAVDSHALTGTVMYTQLGANGWPQPGDIEVMDAGIAARPLIASDGRYVYMIFRTGVFGTVRLCFARAPLSADLRNAHAWSDPTPLSDDGAYYGQIQVLADGTLVVIYNQITGSTLAATPAARGATPVAATPNFRVEVMSRRSTDGGATWSVPAHVSASSERAARTALAVGPDKHTLIAVWDEGYDNLTGQGDPVGGGTAVSTDGGATWQSQQEIRSSRGPFEQTAVAFGASGALLVYRSINQPQLLYRQSADNGRHWGEEQVVPQAVARPYGDKHNFEKISLASDGDGRLLLAYVGQDPQAPNGLGVFVATFAGDTWSTPAEIAAPVGYPEYPRVAIALGNQLQVVYFVRDSEYTVGHYTLWSVAGQSDAHAIAPANPPPVAAPAPVIQPTLPPVRIQPYPTVVAPAPLTAAQQRRLVSPQAEVNGPAFAAFTALLPVLGLILLATAAVHFLSGRRI